MLVEDNVRSKRNSLLFTLATPKGDVTIFQGALS